MTIHKERHVFGSYAHGIQGSGSPADDPDHKFVDGKAEFHAQHDQGRTGVEIQDGLTSVDYTSAASNHCRLSWWARLVHARVRPRNKTGGDAYIGGKHKR